jgi:hypothetical protein
MKYPKISLQLQDGKSRKATEPFKGADHALVSGTCPHCGAEPFKVGGTGRRIAADDRAYDADAVSYCCNKYVGVIRVEVSTLFGVREDEAVSRMGVTIY